MKSLEELFPFTYCGGGYFRETNVPKGKTAKTLHGHEAVKFLYDEMKKSVDNSENTDKVTP